MEHSLVRAIFPRTDGDGMESDNTVCKTEPGSRSSTEIARLLKQENLVVDVTPSANADTRPGVPKPVGSGNVKTPKFVPYEPYKAAVKPILAASKTKKVKSRSDSITSGNEVASESFVCSCAAGSKTMTDDKSLSKMEKEIERLNAELKIQSQVNAELKKLLVASVGEDIQARVQFLTEDKAKLSDEIRKYVERVAVDFEEKEKLAIESDIWRSKFLASSVVIEELAKWKAVLCQRCDDLQNCTKILMNEIDTLRDSAISSVKHLRSLNVAFDPLGASAPKTAEQSFSNALEAAALNTMLAKMLANRLLGTYTQTKEDLETSSVCAVQQTPGQHLAEQLLMTQPTASCLMSELASAANAHQVAALASRSLNKSLFACCSQCKGDVQTI